MNDFGIDLKGKHGVYLEKQFYRPGASVADRTFICEGGSGLKPIPDTSRWITGHWLSDNAKDTINAYSFEYVINDNGSKVKPIDLSLKVEVLMAPNPTEEKPKLVRRKR